MTTNHLFAALMIVGAFACSAPPGNGLLLGGADPMAEGPAGASPVDADAGAAASDSASASSQGMDGGAPVTTVDAGSTRDAAVIPPPPPPTIFTDAGAFVAVTAGDTHNAGQNCMNGCHNHGFTFAGTLTDGVGNPVAGAEVRLVDANGLAITVNTGSTGNFHSSTPFVGAAHVGARTATKVVTMSGTITSGACNGCHATGGTTTPIHVP